MEHSTSSSQTSVSAPPLRKRVNPHHSSISPTRRSSLLSTLCIAPTQDQDDLADLASAWNGLTLSQHPDGLDDEVQRRRDYYYGELLDSLNTVAILLLYADQPMSNLATTWEKKVWCEIYEGAYDLQAYEETMEKDICDLGLWIEDWEDGDGKGLFGDYVVANFGELGREVMNDVVVQGGDEETETEADMDMEGGDDGRKKDVAPAHLSSDGSSSDLYDIRVEIVRDAESD
ncbi:hypothetical protein CFE70_000174 [Pyrenophora teres f. teres 0-1]|uniref:Uncharacterized protein n=2 Tax=Pyrenophora teres f. teres TaxID=97479 RepID=E3RCQ7_PYRTT|nr:hypothetical protein PTT_00796 [Pyrenophora teres f. teres 0-1]KAE8836572.1 hypothetical protein HRS9139_04670 [Pyrenophora teres f. teres]KAE8837456.1 hypothetical protein PTNB85_04791 [Pyrenophora teres f. teres]KAE8862282.1 hypothetical protein PTNB29_04844 [Pyrenophora teres f. teres]KAK1917499.1 hypothetical protein P3342_000212 [Pyrenophora teres f. teres]